MALTKVLIAVKTYPTLSEKYDELVCTAGFLEDGTWIRIYPVPFRKLDYAERYEKWQWIELDLTKNTKDFRKESFRPTDVEGEIRILNKIGTERNWAERRKYVLKKVWDNMTALIAEAKDPSRCTSLAVFKPKQVTDFVWEKCEAEWNPQKLEAVSANQAQFDDEMCFKKDIYFFLGTTKKFHNVAPNPFIIIGTFYPPKDDQLSFAF